MKLNSLLIETNDPDVLGDALELLHRYNQKVKEVVTSDASNELTFFQMEVDEFLRKEGYPDGAYDDEPYGGPMDDGDALASAGMGDDEDYGKFEEFDDEGY